MSGDHAQEGVPPSGELLVRCDRGVATLTLNRPEKLNAITFELMLELRGALKDLAAREDVSCLVLAGAGRSFSAGFDLADLPEDPEVFKAMAATIDELEAFPAPTVARIHGHCLTGALELVLGCDLLVTSDDATFADTHGRWGIVPVCGMSVRLPERIGTAKAKLMSFTGRRIDAQTAERWGLVDHVEPAAGLDDAVTALVSDIQGSSADANRIVKALVATSRGDRTREQRLVAERGLELGVPADRLERLAASKV